MGTVAQWLDERTELSPTAATPLAALFVDYSTWAESERTPHLGKRRLATNLSGKDSLSQGHEGRPRGTALS